MADIRVLSAGAAQSVVARIGRDFGAETGHAVRAEFGAVGAMRERLVAGDKTDVIVLTAALIEGLAQGAHIVPDTRSVLGAVGTGVAVCAGVSPPDVSNEDALRRCLMAAGRLVCPDPAIATAGKVVLQVLERLGIAGAMRERLRFFPNGYAAMTWLAASGGREDMGITQITEIRAIDRVTYVGPLPGALQVKTTYSAAVVRRSAVPEAARAFVARLTTGSARETLSAAGFEAGESM